MAGESDAEAVVCLIKIWVLLDGGPVGLGGGLPVGFLSSLIAAIVFFLRGPS